MQNGLGNARRDRGIGELGSTTRDRGAESSVPDPRYLSGGGAMTNARRSATCCCVIPSSRPSGISDTLEVARLATQPALELFAKHGSIVGVTHGVFLLLPKGEYKGEP